MGINIKRLMADLYELGKIGFIPGKGTSRVAYSENFLNGRELIRSKMEEAGLIISQNAKEGTRPEKKVYHVSESGCKRFRELLYRTLDIDYRPTFDVDAAFYFSDHMDRDDIVKSLQRHFEKLEKAIKHIEEHRQQTLRYLPEDMKVWANIIFEHHLSHYQSELEWTKSSIRDVEEVCFDDED